MKASGFPRKSADFFFLTAIHNYTGLCVHSQYTGQGCTLTFCLVNTFSVCLSSSLKMPWQPASTWFICMPQLPIWMFYTSWAITKYLFNIIGIEAESITLFFYTNPHSFWSIVFSRLHLAIPGCCCRGLPGGHLTEGSGQWAGHAMVSLLVFGGRKG